ncbi:MAG TPA: OmpA family protein [Candidatus Kapabacteria bacterium]|nr:OmpA family protein [Candidatus Kapabacteria bacterium]
MFFADFLKRSGLLIFLLSVLIARVSGMGYRVSENAKLNRSTHHPKSDNHPAAPTTRPAPAPLVAVPAMLPDQDSVDDRPCFTLDGRRMYFGSRRQSKDTWRVTDPDPRYKWDSDLWYRVRIDSGTSEDAVWSSPVNVGPPINNSGGQLNPTISPDGNVLYYVGSGPVLWNARMTDGKFQQPKPVVGLLNRIYSARQFAQGHFIDSVRRLVFQEMLPDSDLRTRAPDAWDLHYREHMVQHLKTQMAVDFATTIRCESSITPDGKFAIISENFGKKGSYGMGGEGGEDLWLVTINQQGAWDSVLALNGNINSEFDETYPFIAADGVTLYFTSNRPCKTCGTNGGRQDIYRTQFNGTHWTDPTPLGPPFNSQYDDYGFSIGPDGQTAYFVSNREGKSRLFQVKLSAEDTDVAPKPVVILQGHISDAKTHRPLRAEVFVDDLSSGKNQLSVFSDSISGNYILAAQRGHRFGIEAEASHHLPHSERFTVPADQPFDRTVLDVELAPEEVGATVEFKNVYFDFGKSKLLPESGPELDRVATFLSKSKKITLEIGGHTDDVGTLQANQKLSEARAQAVLDYLVQHGVNRASLKAVGYGKSRPLVKGTSDEARAKNRRVEMTITSASD